MPRTMLTSTIRYSLGVVDIPLFLNLAAITANGVILNNFAPGFPGKILSAKFLTEQPVSTAGRRADIGVTIDGVPMAGGVVSITSTAATPIGTIILGSSINGNNVFRPDSLIDLVASSVTAHAEGRGTLILQCEMCAL